MCGPHCSIASAHSNPPVSPPSPLPTPYIHRQHWGSFSRTSVPGYTLHVLVSEHMVVGSSLRMCFMRILITSPLYQKLFSSAWIRIFSSGSAGEKTSLRGRVGTIWTPIVWALSRAPWPPMRSHPGQSLRNVILFNIYVINYLVFFWLSSVSFWCENKILKTSKEQALKISRVK